MTGWLDLRLQVNLRAPLRLVCYTQGHDWSDVLSIHTLFPSYRYCKRCNAGVRYQGWKKCWLGGQHDWKPDGLPSSMLRNDGERVPFRQIQRCARCGRRRVIECATGDVVDSRV